jgi:Tfp pilus assembly protein PilX
LKINKKNQHGIALIAALIVLAITLVVTMSLMKSSKLELASAANAADKAFAVEASDAQLRAAINDLEAKAQIPEFSDPIGANFVWWHPDPAPILAAYWKTCASSGSAGQRCSNETITRAGRTMTVQRVIQPTGTPDRNSSTSNGLNFYYRILVLITLDNGSRAEIEGFASKLQPTGGI